MTKITCTVLNLETGRLTATVQFDAGNGEIRTTYPDFSEDDLRAQAAKSSRPDWNTEDVLALAEVALASASEPAPAPEPAPAEPAPGADAAEQPPAA